MGGRQSGGMWRSRRRDSEREVARIRDAEADERCGRDRYGREAMRTGGAAGRGRLRSEAGRRRAGGCGACEAAGGGGQRRRDSL
jgi:hypothetical protein